jgi:hypothetical protein
MVKGCLENEPFESVTMIVKLESTCAVGVPAIVIERVVLLPSESPAVSEPDSIDHMKGAEPPVAVTVAVYGLPRFPAGRLVDVIFSSPAELHPPIPMHATSTAKNRNRSSARFTMDTS